MPTNVINVSLDTTKSPPLLDIQDNGGQNIVNANAQATTITWKLTGNLNQGNFVSMSDPSGQYGFCWDGVQPPAGVFGTPSIGANGNSLSIVDNHLDQGTSGEWIYLLRVNLNGTVYTTGGVLLTGTTNNPIIINR